MTWRISALRRWFVVEAGEGIFRREVPSGGNVAAGQGTT